MPQPASVQWQHRRSQDPPRGTPPRGRGGIGPPASRLNLPQTQSETLPMDTFRLAASALMVSPVA